MFRYQTGLHVIIKSKPWQMAITSLITNNYKHHLLLIYKIITNSPKINDLHLTLVEQRIKMVT